MLARSLSHTHHSIGGQPNQKVWSKKTCPVQRERERKGETHLQKWFPSASVSLHWRWWRQWRREAEERRFDKSLARSLRTCAEEGSVCVWVWLGSGSGSGLELVLRGASLQKYERPNQFQSFSSPLTGSNLHLFLSSTPPSGPYQAKPLIKHASLALALARPQNGVHEAPPNGAKTFFRSRAPMHTLQLATTNDYHYHYHYYYSP